LSLGNCLHEEILKVLNENGEESQKIISFPQFVTFLIRGSRSEHANSLLSRQFHINIHWIPYWKLCAPCNSDLMPDFIVKMDSGNFGQEVRFYITN